MAPKKNVAAASAASAASAAAASVVVDDAPVLPVESLVTDAVEPTAAAELAAEEPVANVVDAALANADSIYQAQVSQYHTIIASAKVGLALAKTAYKDLVRNIKLSHKKSRKVTPRTELHGLSRPVGLSPELEAFLGVEPGTKMSRPDVGRAISEYCIQHGLRGEKVAGSEDKIDHRILLTDAKLRELLSPVPEGKKLGYFNLQHYIKHHFLKAVPVAVAAADAAADEAAPV